MPYARAHRAQRDHRAAMIETPSVPEALWLMEHPPVLTTGLREVSDLPSEDWLSERGVPLVRAERGGLATYHGPGQLVGYAMLRLRPRGLSVPTLIAGIEDGLIGWLSGQGIPAHRRIGAPGVFCSGGKIASVGVHIRRGVCMHGFALNLDVDLTPFTWITPCGLEGVRITSVQAERGGAPTPQDAALPVADQVLWALYAASVDRTSALR